MKNIIVIGLLLVSLNCLAQVPQGIQFQAIARDGFGTPLPSSNLTIRFGLKDTANALVYQETHAVITDQFGLFEAVIGDGTPVSGTFSDVNWKEGQHSVDIDIDSGSGFVNIGNTPLQSVPFGFYTTYADSATFAENGKIKVNGDEELHWLKANGDTTVSIKSDDLNGGGKLVINGVNGTQNASIGSVSATNLNLGYLQLNDTNGISRASLVVDPNNRGRLNLNNSINTSDPIAQIFSDGNDNGFMWLKGKNSFFQFGFQDPSGLEPIFSLNADSVDRVKVSGSQYGEIELKGAQGSKNVFFTSFVDPDFGKIEVADQNSIPKVTLQIHPSQSAGEIQLRGPSTPNVIIGNSSAFTKTDAGRIQIKDDLGLDQIDLRINSAGEGHIYADRFIATGNISAASITAPMINGVAKTFIMPHPQKADSLIAYACIEGPEAAAYERGTSQLINGEAYIPFSDHFEIVVNPKTLTISTSPWSAESRGLAVVERSATGFKVKELFNGKGNYQFDWEAKGVRKGHEDFKVIRERN